MSQQQTDQANLERALHFYNEAQEHEQRGRAGKAESAYRQCLAIHPQFAEALNGLGNILKSRGDLAAAEQAYRQALALYPEEPLILSNIGNVQYLREQYPAALLTLQQALRLDPQHVLANNNLGIVYMQLNRPGEAVACFRSAHTQMPQVPEIMTNLATALCRQQQYAEAIPLLRRSIQSNPRQVDAWLNLGDAIYHMQQLNDALRILDDALSAVADKAAILAKVADIHCQEDDLAKAEEAIRKAIELAPGLQSYQLLLGNILRKQNRPAVAASVLEKAAGLDDSNPAVYRGLGQSLKACGQLSAAAEAFEKAIALDAGDVTSLCSLATLEHTDQGADHLHALTAMLERQDLKTSEQVLLLNATGKLHEAAGNYDAAFDAFKHGNQIKSATVDYDVEARLRTISGISTIFSKEYLERYSDAGYSGATPVFITGMARCGKTLLETLLSRHNAITGGGESSDFLHTSNSVLAQENDRSFPFNLQATDESIFSRIGEAYCRRIASRFESADYVTNTHPGNLEYCGLIRLALPRSKLIICIRNARDACTDIYTKNFNNGHYYSLAHDTLATYYNAQQALTRHWQQVLEDNIMIVDFEQLVREPRAILDEVLAFCGLDGSAVLPGSSEESWPQSGQVIDIWRRYAHQLQPLFKALN